MRVLILEDHKATQKLLRSRLQKEGHTVEAVANGHQGFQLAITNTYDIILSDIEMPGWDGFKFVEALAVVCPHLPIVIISSSSADENIQKKIDRYKNIVGSLPKPFEFDTLFAILSTLPMQSHSNIKKMARIVCTMGPSSNTAEIIGRMLLAGMDVARLNFSHGAYEQHKQTLDAIRLAEKQWDKPVAVLQDLCGPKLRTGRMQDGGVVLVAGQQIVVQAETVEGNAERISTIAPEILSDLKEGEPVLLDDGLLELKVIREGNDEVVCRVVVGGLLKSNKGMNLPATSLSLPGITNKDWRDLDWGLEQSVDYVALSFVRSAEDIAAIKDRIVAVNKGRPKVVAKIEKPEAVKNIREIIEVSDAIMIARGDMGVELPAAKVPRIQRKIIRLCWELNTPVITATQMLDSMTTNSRPTRAEVTDVSAAVGDGTDAVMLSQETAVGVDPVNVVRTMASIICEEERFFIMSDEQRRQLIENGAQVNPVLTAVASLHSIQAVLLLDRDGLLYPELSKWNRTVLSILVTPSMEVARQASLYKNIVPMLVREPPDSDAALSMVLRRVQNAGYVKTGDLMAIVEGKCEAKSHKQQVGSLKIVSISDEGD